MTTVTAAPRLPGKLPAATARLRQQLLCLYLSGPNPSQDAIGWSFFDGGSPACRQTGDCETSPYASAVEAMRDGWRVIQIAQQIPPYPGMEHRTSYLPYEIVLERLVETETQTEVDHG